MKLYVQAKVGIQSFYHTQDIQTLSYQLSIILNEEQFLLEDLQVKVFIKIYSLNQKMSHTLHQRFRMAQITEQACNAYVVLLFIKLNIKNKKC